ncbi:MAG: hypothetical protein NC093_01220 [Alistipes sp.]|nr:hypothetical protein [Alistipes sp.]
MITIRNEKFIRFVTGENGEKRPAFIAELDIDTSAELPKANVINGRILLQGSSALIITENKLAVLAGNGNWYADGEVIK